MTDTQLYETMIDFNSFYVHYLSKMDKAFTGGEFGTAAMRCMAFIKSNGRCTQKELSERFGIDMAYLSRTIGKLTEDGYLQKEANDADKRSHYYELTDTSRKVVLEQEKRMYDHILSTVAHLSNEEKETLGECFSRIKKLLDR